MTLIVRPALSILLGLALTLYGIFHAVTRYPGSDAFAQLAEALPLLARVLLFVLGIVAAAAGAVLLLCNAKRLRYGCRHLQRLTGRTAYGPRDDLEWSPEYR